MRNRILHLEDVLNKIISVIVLLTVIGGTVPVQALIGYDDTMPKGFDRSTADFHFSRADRETSIERWMEEAKSGMTQTLAAWERLAFELYGDPEEFAEAKRILVKWSADELEIRFAQWTVKRFFGNDYYLTITELSEKIRNDDVELLFNTDDEGNVLFDEDTGDPLIIRPGERDFAADMEARRDKIENYMEEGFRNYKKNIEVLYPELLDYIDEEKRFSFMERLNEYAVETGDYLKRDMMELVRREEQLFVTQRTGDIYSLRKKTDFEAAEFISSELILATEKICTEGIAAIEERIEQARAGIGDLALAGEDWLLAYQEQFNRGLKAWEEAEESFFIRRIEWEQESGRHYSEGEEAWAAAFNRLSEEKEAWEIKSRDLFDEGEKMFKDASLKLQNAINEARIEFENDAALRMQSGSERAAAWINTYITSGSLVAAAQENIDFWLLDLGEKGNSAPKLLSGKFKEWLNGLDAGNEAETVRLLLEIEEKEKKIKGLEEENKKYSSTAIIVNKNKTSIYELNTEIARLKNQVELLENDRQWNARKELKEWYDIYDDYLKKAIQARDNLINEFSLVIGSGALADILSEGVTSEDFNLDEYQIELIRAKAIASYWEKRVNIARAVNAYAAELKAERMTYSEQVNVWENAKAEYDEALAAYEDAHKELSKAGEDIIDVKQALSAASVVLGEIDAKLNKLNGEYSALLSLLSVDNKDVVLLELAEKYKELLRENSIYQMKGEDAAYINYIMKAQELGFAEALEANGKIIRDVVMGNVSDPVTLSDLYAEYENIWVPEIPELLSTNIGVYKIDENNYYYGIINYLLYERSLQVAGGDEEAGTLPEDTDETGTETVVETEEPPHEESDGGEQENQIEEEETEEEDANEETDVEEEEDGEADVEEKTDLVINYDELILGAVKAAKDSVKRRYDGRIAVLNLLTAQSTEEWYKLEYGIPKETEIAFEYGVEYRLYADLEAASKKFDEALDQLKTEGWPEYICYIILDDLVAEMERAQYILSAYQLTANVSSAVIDERNTLALKGMADFFLSYGIVSDNGLPGMKATADVIFNEEGDIAENIGAFLAGLNNCFAEMPEWIQNEAFNWKDAFIEYSAAKSINDNRTSGLLINDVKNEYIVCMMAIENAEDGDIAVMLAVQMLCLEYVYQFLASIDEQRTSINAANSNKEKHWRQYIVDDFLEYYNKDVDADKKLSAGIIGSPEASGENKAAANYREGNLADKFEKVEYEAAKLNYAIRLNLNFGGEKTNARIMEITGKYISDMNAEWSEDDINQTGYIYKDRLNVELSLLNKTESLMSILSSEIARIGSAYEKSNTNDNITKEMDKIKSEIDALRHEYQNAMRIYKELAEEFGEKGTVYDKQYTTTKKRYNAMETARFEYEKQDAVKRWASTAYLEYDGAEDVLVEQYKNPVNELSYAIERLRRTEIVLAALKDVYDNGETRRPFNNAAYNDLYERYKSSFERLILSMKMKSELDATIRAETSRNTLLYDIYTKALQPFGSPLFIEENYVSSENKEAWKLTDIITVKNGKLSFSYSGSGYTLEGQTAKKSNMLAAYFLPDSKHETEVYVSSDFELALRQLSNNLDAVITDETKYRQWSMAHDYLIIQLQKNNRDVSELQSYYRRDAGLSGDLSSKRATFNGIKFGEVSDIDMSDGELLIRQKTAWESLSANEKADMEFYTILTLLDAGGGNSKGFKFATWVTEYDHVVDIVNKNKNKASDVARGNFIAAASLTSAAAILACIPGGQGAAITLGVAAAAALTAGLLYDDAAKTLSETLTELKKSLNNYNKIVSDAFSGLRTSTDSIKNSFANYKESCDRLAKLKGETKDGSNVTWRTIEISLSTAGLDPAEISKINLYWREMNSDIKVESRDTTDALTQLVQWSRSEREDIKRDLENEYADAEVARMKSQKTYRTLSQAYIAGEENIDELRKALYDTYGANSPAIKNHLENLESSIVNNAGGVMTSGSSYMTEYFSLAGELVNVIGRAYHARYVAELAAREVEWEQQVFDIGQKLKSWREAAGVILAKGRDDWKKGLENMHSRYSAWTKEFSQEYEQIASAWDTAYLAGLEDKAAWVAEVGEAAVNASNIAVLESVGASAEQRARVLDTRDPIAFNRVNGILEAEKSLSDILKSAGILNMAEVLGVAGSAAMTVASAVRIGVGGVNVWNAATIQLEAADMAREANEALAAREAKTLAANFKRMALSALGDLKDYVDEANRNFDEGMDDTFIVEGRWSRSGRNYTNSILVDASLAGGKRENVSVEAFRYYQMEQPADFKTDVDESRLENLDSFTVQLLIKEMGDELKKIQESIFGTEEENKEYQKKGRNERSAMSSPGLFGKHTGYGPKPKDNPDLTPDTITENNIFVHKGSGETGRLMSKYIYWKFRETFGFAAVETAAWDKKLWDDSGSFFKAPTIRNIADMAVQAVGTVATAAIAPFTGGASLLAYAGLSTLVNMTDDALFTALDVAGGYKDGAEAGVAFTTKTATTFASSAINMGFSDINGKLMGGMSDGIFKTTAETGMAGVQAFTTGTVTNAISSINYLDGSFGFDGDGFMRGLEGAGIGALTAGVTSTMGSVTAGKLSSLKEEGLAISKFYGGAINLGTAVVGKLAEYGAYTVSSLAEGGAFKDAYDDMGGLTLNIANLGSIIDMVGIGIARNNSTAQSALGGVAQLLSGAGLLEINIGSGGVTGQIGSGGINVGGAVYDLVKRGLDKAALERYAADNQMEGAIAMKNYVYGDWTAENTSTRLTSGLDELRLEKEVWNENGELAAALTTTQGNGRLIQMVDSGNIYNNAIQLQHESYRDGIIGSGQIGETVQAVIAHTMMANLMRNVGAGFETTASLARDLAAWDMAVNSGNMSGFALYAMSNYDSSADYWKLMEDGSLAYDGDGWLKDPNGNFILDEDKDEDEDENRTGLAAIEGGLAKILGISPEEAAEMMRDAGMTEKEKGIWWKHSGNEGKSITLANEKYAGIYNTSLIQHNTLEIYKTLLAAGRMMLSPRGSVDKYMSYEEYKERNFTIGSANYRVKDSYSGYDVTTLLNARGSLTENPHRGVDGAVPEGSATQLLFFNDTSVVGSIGRDKDSPQGLYVTVQTDITYNFKGKKRTDSIYYRVMHLSEILATNGSSVTQETILGKTGKTGKLIEHSTGEEVLYDPHVHEDVYTPKMPSPYLDYITSKTADVAARLYYAPEDRFFYDKFIFANKNEYKIRDEAKTYNKKQ